MMLPLIAQLSAESLGHVGTWILGLSGTVFLVNQVLEFYKTHIKEQPTPANTYATKEELRFVHGRITRERTEINAQVAKLEDDQRERAEEIDRAISSLRQEMKNENQGLHTRVTELLGLTREMKGRLEHAIK